MSVVIVVAALLPATALAAAPTAQDFTDWTAASGSPAVAIGTLHGQSLTLSGTHVFPPPVSVVDGHWTFFSGPDFSPSLPSTDMIQIGATTLTEMRHTTHEQSLPASARAAGPSHRSLGG